MNQLVYHRGDGRAYLIEDEARLFVGASNAGGAGRDRQINAIANPRCQDRRAVPSDLVKTTDFGAFGVAASWRDGLGAISNSVGEADREGRRTSWRRRQLRSRSPTRQPGKISPGACDEDADNPATANLPPARRPARPSRERPL